MPAYVLTGLTQPLSFELEQGFNRLGRNPTNDLRLRDATVSSFHCEIVVKQQSIVVRDLGSSNGTFVDGRQITEGLLAPGSVLRLGSFELKLEEQADSLSAAVPAPTATPEPLTPEPLLPDGRRACGKHSDTHAAFECPRCQTAFCSECVRVLRLTGGEARMFCPHCSGLCQPLPLPAGVPTTPPKKPSSILGRLSQTIRIRLK
jgi:hypothetical protein